jgi:NADH-quinone oxidoreductase subunit G
MSDMVTINVDGVDRQVPAGETLIQACLDTGSYIPHFCYHPRMEAVGMCRQCMVEVESPRGTMLVPSCTMPVNDGMVVHTQSETVKKVQEGMLEFLLLNHPLDCPVCDRGGECPLQDQTMACGPGESRFVEQKRQYEKPVPISDLVFLDRERCILCARCVRFSDEISGDPLIEFSMRGAHNQIRTFPDEPFASYFSGNTVQICPVGALTAAPYRFRARPWDLKKVGSTCTHCTTGCDISVDSSENQVLRFNGVDNDFTTHGWLSDKCRFGFEFLGSDQRVTTPLIKGETGEFAPATWMEALDVVSERLSEVIDADGGGAIAALGGARGTNEDAYALSKFMRTVIGSNHVDGQMDDGLDPQFLAAAAGRGQINDLEKAKTILLWGPDLKEENGTLYLRVRRAAQALGATLIVVHPRRTGLDDRAAFKFSYRPGEGAETLAGLAAGEGEFAAARQALTEGPVVALVGRTGYAEDPRLAEAVAAFVRGLPDSSVLTLARRSNVYGALDMGLAPTLLPGRVSTEDSSGRELLESIWGELPAAVGRDAKGILQGVRDGAIKALILQGSDPARDVPDNGLAEEALAGAQFIVAIDLFVTASTSYADVILPAVAFTEKDGTVTNLEGRVQKVNQIVAPPGQSRADWSILDDLSRRLGTPLGFGSAEVVAKEIAAAAPAYGGFNWDATDCEEGLLVPFGDAVQPLQYMPVAFGEPPAISHQPSADSTMLLHSARTLYDDGVLLRNGLSLHKLAPGGFAGLSKNDAKRLDVTDGDTVAVNGVSLSVRVDDSLLDGVVHVPFNQPGTESVGDGLNVDVRVVREGDES